MKADHQAEAHKSGMVAIVGRPNVGKSTLLNHIVGEKVAIVTKIPQTTRNQIRGIYNDRRGQIVFIDTPGLFLGKDKLDRLLQKSSLSTFKEVDCLIYLVDAGERTGKEEENIVRRLKGVKAPIILGFNKIDRRRNFIPQYIALWENIKGKPVTEIKNLTLLPLSAKTGINTDKLLDILFEKLPLGPALYPPDTVSDTPQKLVIADIVREKLLNLLRDEVPHSLAVVIEEISPRKKNVVYIRAQIFLERASQKEIVIGHKGQVLKAAGTYARKDLEQLLGNKVFLELYVRSSCKWRENISLLEEMGYGQ